MTPCKSCPQYNWKPLEDLWAGIANDNDLILFCHIFMLLMLNKLYGARVAIRMIVGS